MGLIQPPWLRPRNGHHSLNVSGLSIGPQAHTIVCTCLGIFVNADVITRIKQHLRTLVEHTVQGLHKFGFRCRLLPGNGTLELEARTQQTIRKLTDDVELLRLQ